MYMFFMFTESKDIINKNFQVKMNQLRDLKLIEFGLLKKNLWNPNRCVFSLLL